MKDDYGRYEMRASVEEIWSRRYLQSKSDSSGAYKNVAKAMPVQPMYSEKHQEMQEAIIILLTHLCRYY